MSRKSEGRALMIGHAMALAQARTFFDDQAQQLRSAIAVDIEALRRELDTASRELAEARAELEHFRTLSATKAVSLRLH
jgi:hypothetical protein